MTVPARPCHARRSGPARRENRSAWSAMLCPLAHLFARSMAALPGRAQVRFSALPGEKTEPGRFVAKQCRYLADASIRVRTSERSEPKSRARSVGSSPPTGRAAADAAPNCPKNPESSKPPCSRFSGIYLFGAAPPCAARRLRRGPYLSGRLALPFGTAGVTDRVAWAYVSGGESPGRGAEEYRRIPAYCESPPIAAAPKPYVSGAAGRGLAP